MGDDFTVYIFYPDGASPESAKRRISELSPKWTAVCGDLLAHFGPVMKHNMGSTLSHFDIHMAGPSVELLAFGHPCFRLSLSLGTESEQDRAATAQFREIWTRLAKSAGRAVDPAAGQSIDHACAEQCVLVLDRCIEAVDDDQKLALLQLGEHLAGAYFRYCSANQATGG